MCKASTFRTQNRCDDLCTVSNAYHLINGRAGSLVKELQTITRSAPNIKSRDREHRDYNEKMTGVWHELVHFPDELLCRTALGMTFNIFEDDFKSIEQYVDSLS